MSCLRRTNNSAGRLRLAKTATKVCVTSAVVDQLTGYRQVESFGASEVGVTLGRYYKGIDRHVQLRRDEQPDVRLRKRLSEGRSDCDQRDNVPSAGRRFVRQGRVRVYRTLQPERFGDCPVRRGNKRRLEVYRRCRFYVRAGRCDSRTQQGL